MPSKARPWGSLPYVESNLANAADETKDRCSKKKRQEPDRDHSQRMLTDFGTDDAAAG